MIAIPFPLFLLEFIIFWFAAKEWGFLNAVGLYLLPCFLGFLILNIVGRKALMNVQGAAMQGQVPANKLLHSGAIFISGILFLIPAIFSRVLALVLFLPGLRHLAIWRFKKFMANKMAEGSAQAFSQVFSFGRGPFGFGAGSTEFRYYDFNSQNSGFRDVGNPNELDAAPEERVVHEANVVDITPLEVTHADNKEGKEGR